MKSIFATLIALILLAPSLASAQTIRAGTDDYLRDVVGLTDEQLNAYYLTELREPFELASGLGEVFDPAGDVLDRGGTTSNIQVPWGDITSAKLTKNDSIQEWVVEINLAGRIPEQIPTSRLVNFVFLIDSDLPAQNAQAGTGVGTDAEFRLSLSHKEGEFVTKYRWYNPEADFWGVDRKTSMRFDIFPTQIVFYIPFTEIPGSIKKPNWRVLAAIEDAGEQQNDLAPSIGFPSPIEEPIPTMSSKDFQPKGSKGRAPYIIIGLIALVIGAAFLKKRHGRAE